MARKEAGALFAPLILLVMLPLAGVAAAGKSISTYMEFPPVTMYVRHAGFSPAIFIGLAAAILAVVLLFVIRVCFWNIRHPSCPISTGTIPGRGIFPWWGWLGLVGGAAAWTLAWNRFPWFAPFQTYTFTPLWIAYILVVNALARFQSGRCMLTDRPRYFLVLFPVSALFWWFFEYLNRFVQNWNYEGVERFSGLEYFVNATLPFSTVLPAVLGTCQLIERNPMLTSGLSDFVRIEPARPRIVAGIAFVISSAGLALVGVLPDHLFPLLWISPLCVITSIQALRGEGTIFEPLRRGDWRRIFLLAVSALICGVFWELWNYHSLAKWTYDVPFVSEFKFFEMPLLGYAGYLPFGLECAVIGDIVATMVRDRIQEPPSWKTAR